MSLSASLFLSLWGKRARDAQKGHQKPSCPFTPSRHLLLSQGCGSGNQSQNPDGGTLFKVQSQSGLENSACPLPLLIALLTFSKEKVIRMLSYDLFLVKLCLSPIYSPVFQPVLITSQNILLPILGEYFKPLSKQSSILLGLQAECDPMHASPNERPLPLLPSSSTILMSRALQGSEEPVSFGFLTLEDKMILHGGQCVWKLMRKSKKFLLFFFWQEFSTSPQGGSFLPSHC